LLLIYKLEISAGITLLKSRYRIVTVINPVGVWDGFQIYAMYGYEVKSASITNIIPVRRKETR